MVDRVCPSCKTINDTGASYCKDCGVPINDQVPNHPVINRKANPMMNNPDYVPLNQLYPGQYHPDLVVYQGKAEDNEGPMIGIMILISVFVVAVIVLAGLGMSIFIAILFAALAVIACAVPVFFLLIAES